MSGDKKISVLVVDDQPGVRYLLEIVVSGAGHLVDTAQNGLEAIEKVRTFNPDLIFMDVRMPFMGGIEALARIKVLAPDTDIVLMTAYGSDETIELADKQGSLCCMAKPFDIEDIKNFLDVYTEGVLKTSRLTI